MAHDHMAISLTQVVSQIYKHIKHKYIHFGEKYNLEYFTLSVKLMELILVGYTLGRKNLQHIYLK